MSDLPLVSVIIPTYNYGHFIDETLHSLYAQTYDHWEASVVDDGSTDDTAAVVHEHMGKDRRIKFYQQENRNQAAAKNLGLHHCSGQYVQFLDADDLLESRKIESQVGYLERHPGVDLVYGSVRYFRTDVPEERRYSMGSDNSEWVPQFSGNLRKYLSALIQNNIMAINCPLIRRSVIEEVGPFDEDLPPVEDWEYWIRCAFHDKVFAYADFPDALALVRCHPNSSSKNGAHVGQ